MIFTKELRLHFIFIYLQSIKFIIMNIRFIYLLIFILGISTLSFAPPVAAAAAGATGGPSCWPPPCVPIDGGISLLIAAGAIYGGKKLYLTDKKQKKTL